MELNASIPSGPLAEKWDNHRFSSKLVNPANRRKFKVIVVGTGLAGASAAATLAELGYKVEAFCIQDSPRRAHSIAAQGGINAAKNYQNDGDSVSSTFLRHHQGRRFPGPGSKCLSAGPGHQPKSSTSALPRACPLPGNMAASWPTFLWRRPGVANLLCPWTDRTAAPARCLQRPVPPDQSRQGHHVHPAGNDGRGRR